MAIARNKKRLTITIEKEDVEKIRDAAASWGMSISEYLTSLARVDRETGLTAQVYQFAGSGAEVKNEETN